VGVCDDTEVVLERRAGVTAVAVVVDVTDVTKDVAVDVVGDDDDEAVLAGVCVLAAWLPLAENFSSLRYPGRGGTAGFGPVLDGLDFADVCFTSAVATSSSTDGGVAGAASSASPSSAAERRIPTSKILTCVRSTTTRRRSAVKSSACGWTSCVEVEAGATKQPS